VQLYRSINVKDCQGTLIYLYSQFIGQAFTSFEGDLNKLNLLDIPDVIYTESIGLKRQTISPILDFAIIPITTKTIPLLKSKISAPKLFGKHGEIIHVQMAINDKVIFSACDNFHKDCTVVSKIIPDNILIEMKKIGLIREYESA
jgi:hypothetical protein